MRFTEHELTMAVTGAAKTVMAGKKSRKRGADIDTAWNAMDRRERYGLLDLGYLGRWHAGIEPERHARVPEVVRPAGQRRVLLRTFERQGPSLTPDRRVTRD